MQSQTCRAGITHLTTYILTEYTFIVTISKSELDLCATSAITGSSKGRCRGPRWRQRLLETPGRDVPSTHRSPPACTTLYFTLSHDADNTAGSSLSAAQPGASLWPTFAVHGRQSCTGRRRPSAGPRSPRRHSNAHTESSRRPRGPRSESASAPRSTEANWRRRHPV